MWQQCADFVAGGRWAGEPSRLPASVSVTALHFIFYSTIVLNKKEKDKESFICYRVI